MLRKKILFVLHTMNIGGMEKAFLGTLTQFPVEAYDIHVAFLEKKGELLNCLPSYVKVSEIKEYIDNKTKVNNPPLSVIIDLAKRGNLLTSILMFYDYVLDKYERTVAHKLSRIFKKIPMCSEYYDIAIAYAGPFPFIDYYVCQKVNASKKWVWIHYDVSRNGADTKVISHLYHHYEKINIVSMQGKQVFDSIFPEFAFKTHVCYNVIARDQILQWAEEFTPPLQRL